MPTKKKLYSLTDEHRAQLKPWADKWILNAMSTSAMTEEDRSVVHGAVLGLYSAANLPAPKAVVFCASPISGAIAAGIAAGIWFLREHPEKHQDLFGRAVSEGELCAAIQPAAALAVRAGMRQLETLKSAPPVTITTQISAATYAATAAATRAATAAATAAATYAATRAATAAATAAATYAATYAATDDATLAATRAATAAATAAATYAATDDATLAATDAATDDATRAATAAATAAATRAATDDATDDATLAATDAATYAATAAATLAATRAATAAATDDALIRFLLACGNGACWRMRNGGNQWSAWVSYLSFFRHVGKLDIDYSKYAHWETCAERSGPRYMHMRFAIVCDRPEVLKVDERRRPHCADGPSHRWRDGWELYHWRGLRVPKTWITDSKNLDPTTALTWQNIEQRRAAAEIIGWRRVLEQLSPRVVNRNKDPEIGELLEVELPDAGTARFLRVRCGTGRDFVLSVPREMKTALQANAWTYDLKPKEYKLEART